MAGPLSPPPAFGMQPPPPSAPSEDPRGGALRGADALREGPPSGWLAAVEAYLALAGGFRPGEPEDDARVRWLLTQPLHRSDRLQRVALRWVGSGDRELRHAARLTLAECAAEARDYRTAEQHVRSVYEETRGTDLPTGIRTLTTLGAIFMRQGREVELLLVARRLASTAARLGETEGRIAAAGTEFAAAFALDDVERMDDAATRGWALIDGDGPADAGRPRREWALRRTEVALRRGDPARARRLLRIATSPLPDGSPPGTEPGVAEFQGARISLLHGRAADALGAARAALAGPPVPVPRVAVRLRLVEATALAEAEGPAAALGAARGLLADLQDPGATALGHGTLLRIGAALGNLLRDRVRSPDDARAAYDLATTAVFQRLLQIHRTAREMPWLFEDSAGDGNLLAEYRARFLRRHGEIAGAVAALLRLGVGPLGGAVRAMAAPEGLVVTCAWCHRVRTADGLWLPLEAFLPEGGSLRVTHGICPDCYGRQLGTPPPSAPAPDGAA